MAGRMHLKNGDRPSAAIRPVALVKMLKAVFLFHDHLRVLEVVRSARRRRQVFRLLAD